jgi:DNA-binding CsgD family transcriptional regulator
MSLTLEAIAKKLARRNAGLSQAQGQMLELLSAGRQDKQIVRQLALTPAAVKSRKRDLRLKLGASNSFQAAVIATKRGLI